MKKQYAISLIVTLLTLSRSLSAATKSTASFLELQGTARANALQGANTAIAGSLDALVFNPGGLAGLGRKQFNITHAELVSGANFDAVDYGHPIAHGAFGINVSRDGVPSFEGRDANRQVTGTVSADDIVAGLSYGHEINSYMGLGATVKYMQSRLADSKASSMALDLGSVTRVPGQALWLGASVLNFGAGLRYANERNPLPLTVAVGGAMRIGGVMNITLDIKQNVPDRRTDVVTGLEYSVTSAVLIRGGYLAPLSVSGTDRLSTMQYLRGGLGLKFSSYQFDYSVAPFGDTGFTHRFTLSAIF